MYSAVDHMFHLLRCYSPINGIDGSIAATARPISGSLFLTHPDSMLSIGGDKKAVLHRLTHSYSKNSVPQRRIEQPALFFPEQIPFA